MGYEVKVFVGEVNQRITDDEKHGCAYFSVVAMLDLCKPGHKSEIGALSERGQDDENIVKRLQGESPFVYLYGLDGNTKFTEDCYGKKFSALPIDEVIEALEHDEAQEKYWRFAGCISMLKGLKRAWKKRGKALKVVLYGH